MRVHRQKGFTIIELLIVVAIIMIIAAIAIPKLGDARRLAYEMAAIRTLQTLNTGQVQYFSTYGRFASTLMEMGPAPGGAARSASSISPVSARLSQNV